MHREIAPVITKWSIPEKLGAKTLQCSTKVSYITRFKSTGFTGKLKENKDV